MSPTVRNAVIGLSVIVALAGTTVVLVTDDESSPTKPPVSSAALSTDTKYGFEPGECSSSYANLQQAGAFACATDRAYEGAGSVRFTIPSGNAKYGRTVTYLTATTGDTFWAGGAYYLPPAVEDGGYLTILRADDYGETNQLVGIESFSGSNGWHIMAGTYSSSVSITPNFQVPENQWVWLEYKVVLGGGGQVEVNGQVAATWTTRSPTKLTRQRHGITSTGGQTVSGVYLDRAWTGRTRLGPLGAVPPPPPPPPPPTTLEWNCNAGVCYWDAAAKEVKVRVAP